MFLLLGKISDSDTFLGSEFCKFMLSGLNLELGIGFFKILNECSTEELKWVIIC